MTQLICQFANYLQCDIFYVLNIYFNSAFSSMYYIAETPIFGIAKDQDI